MQEIESLTDDLLCGAEAIAEYTGFGVRRVYYLAAIGALPVFRLGRGIGARKSQIRESLSATATRRDAPAA